MRTGGIGFVFAWAIVPAAYAQDAPELKPFREAEKRIVRLAPAAFPELPGNVAGELRRRGCGIPQEAFTKRPHNVIKGEFAKPGQTNWAVLCSVEGVSRILVFWNGSEKNPAAIAGSEDWNYLQVITPGHVGYSRGIRTAGKDFIMSHRRAKGGPALPPIEHQGIDDAFIEKASVAWYFHRGNWMRLTGAD